jgi:hypothetical protein
MEPHLEMNILMPFSRFQIQYIRIYLQSEFKMFDLAQHRNNLIFSIEGVHDRNFIVY